MNNQAQAPGLVKGSGPKKETSVTMQFADFYGQSIEQRDGFWAEQARLVDWHAQPSQVCDYSNPPFARWFAGGQTNLCHNAVDRHVSERGEQNALIAISTETNTEKAYSYRELLVEVQRMAAALQSLGVQQGDRVATLAWNDHRHYELYFGVTGVGAVCHQFGIDGDIQARSL